MSSETLLLGDFLSLDRLTDNEAKKKLNKIKEILENIRVIIAYFYCKYQNTNINDKNIEKKTDNFKINNIDINLVGDNIHKPYCYFTNETIINYKEDKYMKVMYLTKSNELCNNFIKNIKNVNEDNGNLFILLYNFYNSNKLLKDNVFNIQDDETKAYTYLNELKKKIKELYLNPPNEINIDNKVYYKLVCFKIYIFIKKLLENNIKLSFSTDKNFKEKYKSNHSKSDSNIANDIANDILYYKIFVNYNANNSARILKDTKNKDIELDTINNNNLCKFDYNINIDNTEIDNKNTKLMKPLYVKVLKYIKETINIPLYKVEDLSKDNYIKEYIKVINFFYKTNGDKYKVETTSFDTNTIENTFKKLTDSKGKNLKDYILFMLINDFIIYFEYIIEKIENNIKKPEEIKIELINEYYKNETTSPYIIKELLNNNYIENFKKYYFLNTENYTNKNIIIIEKDVSTDNKFKRLINEFLLNRILLINDVFKCENIYKDVQIRELNISKDINSYI